MWLEKWFITVPKTSAMYARLRILLCAAVHHELATGHRVAWKQKAHLMIT